MMKYCGCCDILIGIVGLCIIGIKDLLPKSDPRIEEREDMINKIEE